MLNQTEHKTVRNAGTRAPKICVFYMGNGSGLAGLLNTYKKYIVLRIIASGRDLDHCSRWALPSL